MKLVLLVLLFPLFLFSQNEEDEIVGVTTRVDLQNDKYFGHVFQEEYANYSFDTEILKELKTYIYAYQITIVMGTWCGDSQEQVPRFMKVLDKIDYNTKNITFIGVDHQKQANGTEVEKLKIERVPTFIVYNSDGQEVGRIIETPQESLEEDLLGIINK